MLPPLLSLITALCLIKLELVTSKYPQTFFLIKRSTHLYLYSLSYGIISFFLMFGLKFLIDAGSIKLEGYAISNVWVQAIIIGIATKALLHIRFFNVSIGSQSFPIGLETIVQLFEPWLLRKIEIFEFNELRTFIQADAERYKSLNYVKRKIKENMPPLPNAENIAFKEDLNGKATVSEAMELYLRYFGKRSFKRIFPVKKS